VSLSKGQLMEPIVQQPGSEPRLTYEQFLEFVADKDERYEFVDGHAVAMGIPSDEHQLLAQNLANRLAGHLAGQPCRVLLSAQLWTGRDRAPDVMVVCSRTSASETGTRIPEFIAEIHSPNRGDDLGLKFIEYQSMPSIEAYLVIDSTKRWAILFHRNAEGKFQADRDYTEGLISLNSINYALDLDALYNEAGIA